MNRAPDGAARRSVHLAEVLAGRGLPCATRRLHCSYGTDPPASAGCGRAVAPGGGQRHQLQQPDLQRLVPLQRGHVVAEGWYCGLPTKLTSSTNGAAARNGAPLRRPGPLRLRQRPVRRAAEYDEGDRRPAGGAFWQNLVLFPPAIRLALPALDHFSFKEWQRTVS